MNELESLEKAWLAHEDTEMGGIPERGGWPKMTSFRSFAEEDERDYEDMFEQSAYIAALRRNDPRI